MKNIQALLDSIADKIQENGFEKYAERVDAVSNTLSVLAAVEQEKELRLPLMELPPEVSKSGKGKKIIQGFIIEVPGCDVRIRKVDEDYTMTAKYRPLSQEAETNITKEIFDALWPSISRKQSKTRYEYKGWEIDVMDTGEVVAEFEYSKEKTVDLPTHWKIKT